MELRIRLRHKDKDNELFGVFVTDHPNAPRGKFKRVGYTAPGGNLCFIRQNGLQEPEMKQVAEMVKAWQADDEAIEASRKDKEETF